ncbi:MAG TPA: hypothetical protein VNY29_20340 [Terriglobales bacterium]|jgi:hypothetical protein|nr:hypothetical protein [Terriglobales bacterium]
MTKRILLTAAVLMIALTMVTGVRQGYAQDSAKAASDGAEPGHAYRLDFTVSEIENGKKIDSRQYSMNLRGGDVNEVKIGSRVPIDTKNGEFQYIDVGTNIWCALRDRKDISWVGNGLLLNVKSEISNFAVPEQQGQNMRPILRQLKIDASTIADIGKPLVIGSVDDPNSKRQFQLELTITKLR